MGNRVLGFSLRYCNLSLFKLAIAINFLFITPRSLQLLILRNNNSNSEKNSANPLSCYR